MSKIILAAILIGMIFLFGCTAQTPSDDVQGDVQEDSGTNDSSEGEAMEGDSKEDSSAKSEPEKTASGFTRYTKATYEQAKSEGKVIYLYFTANWCPTCRVQRPINKMAFENPEMPENVATFSIHFNDDETNDEDKEISRKFGIVYQHTQIVLDSQGNETYRSTGIISEGVLISQIKKASA